MKRLLRAFLVNGLSLGAADILLQGFMVTGTLTSYFIASILLTLGFLVVKPLIDLITIPLRIVTFGLFSIVTIGLIIFLLTYVYADVSLTTVSTPALTTSLFTLPSVSISQPLSYLIVSATIYAVRRFVSYIFEL